MSGLPRGLVHLPKFVPPSAHDALVTACLNLRRGIESLVGDREAVSTSIPQPAHVKSAEHNLNSEEEYVPLMLPVDWGRKLRCEHFSRYGEDGHELTYFRGNQNIPQPVWDEVVTRVHDEVEEVQALSGDNPQNLLWNLTFNTYSAVEGKRKTAGFPFHVDIHTNGHITMILSLLQGATMELAHEDDANNEDVTALEMGVGSLLLLSGESRYNWRHRVLPGDIDALPTMEIPADSGNVRRLSLVLGCAPKRKGHGQLHRK